MYRKQLRFQKIICMLCLIAAAITFVYSLGIITEIYDGLSLATNPKKPTDDGRVAGSTILFQMHDFNTQYVNFALCVILLCLLMFLMNTQIRRKYYIGNYVSIALYSVASLVLTVWSHFQICAFKVQYLTTVDFEALKELCEVKGKPFIQSTLFLDLHYIVAAVSLVAVVGLIVNTVWKIKVQRAEQELLNEAKEVSV